MQIDIGNLRKEIVELLKQPIKKTTKTTSIPVALQVIERVVRPIIDTEILRHDLLGQYDILGGCDDCLESKKLKKAKVLGSGAFGTVFDIGSARCIKVETIFDAKIGLGIENAILMGKKKVGPKVHKWHLCGCNSAVYLVMEMDKISGMTLGSWLRKKTRGIKELDDMYASVKKKIQKMKASGVTHNDLHADNVMIDKSNVPWIIDFTYNPDGNEWVLQAIDQYRKDDSRAANIFTRLCDTGVIDITTDVSVIDSDIVKRMQHWKHQ
jgi:hypothetical protein